MFRLVNDGVVEYIVKIYDYIIIDDLIYIILEFCNGDLE